MARFTKKSGGHVVYMIRYEAPNIGQRFAAVDASTQEEAFGVLRHKLGRRITLIAARRARSSEIPSHYHPLENTGEHTIWVPRRFGDRRRRVARNSRGRFTRA